MKQQNICPQVNNLFFKSKLLNLILLMEFLLFYFSKILSTLAVMVYLFYWFLVFMIYFIVKRIFFVENSILFYLNFDKSTIIIGLFLQIKSSNCKKWSANTAACRGHRFQTKHLYLSIGTININIFTVGPYSVNGDGRCSFFFSTLEITILFRWTIKQVVLT